MVMNLEVAVNYWIKQEGRDETGAGLSVKLASRYDSLYKKDCIVATRIQTLLSSLTVLYD